MRIGEVAECTGLSLRTIRYYEEIGLTPPSARSSGGFRLYTEQDIDRLELVKRMQFIDLSIDEMRDLLGTFDALESGSPVSRQLEELHGRLEMYRQLARQRVCTLRGQLAGAEHFSRDLDERGSRHAPGAKRPR